jgi:hypothetical protein
MENVAPTHVLCPLVNQKIEAIDCIENRDIVDGFIGEKHMPKKFKLKFDWKEICLQCKWHYFN